MIFTAIFALSPFSKERETVPYRWLEGISNSLRQLQSMIHFPHVKINNLLGMILEAKNDLNKLTLAVKEDYNIGFSQMNLVTL